MSGPYFDDGQVRLFLGDCLDVLPTLPDSSVDAVVCDPPYGLEFMGKEWDAPWKTGNGFRRAANDADAGRDSVFGRTSRRSPEYIAGRGYQQWCEAWARECLRVLKPGGHLLAFGAPRTYHRLAAGIEDAGFEIRDSINCSFGLLAWYYGSGFPKSKAVSRDTAFCQCLPPVRNAAAEEAAESAAEVLLADLRRSGEADATHISYLHGVSVSVHPDYALPGSAEQDLLADVRSKGDRRSEQRTTPEAEDCHPAMPGVRCGVQPTNGMAGARGDADLFPSVQWETAGSGTGEACPQGPDGLVAADDRALAGKDARSEQPIVGGRRDIQAPEGQLHRSAIRALPTGSDDDGALGRLHHGAPSGDGPLGRQTVAADGSCEPHRPQPTEQCALESGVVSVERGSQARRGWPVCSGCGKPQVPAGLGTALKPAWEAVVVARRPLAGTVAANVLEHGTGALNIAECRVGSEARVNNAGGASSLQRVSRVEQGYRPNITTSVGEVSEVTGRWPANLVLTHSAGCDAACVPGCPVAELDRQSGVLTSGANPTRRGSDKFRDAYGDFAGQRECVPARGADSGGASRFFPVFRYEAKAPASERPKLADGTAWPTVKPVELMRWLVRLVTPPGGTVLDPFCGTGATGEAAIAERFRCVLVEKDPVAAELAMVRLRRPIQPSLFGDLGAAS